jgi:hypothetical protein
MHGQVHIGDGADVWSRSHESTFNEGLVKIVGSGTSTAWDTMGHGSPESAMRMRGLEPPRAFAHTDLNRARLPIPPHPRGQPV